MLESLCLYSNVVAMSHLAMVLFSKNSSLDLTQEDLSVLLDICKVCIELDSSGL